VASPGGLASSIVTRTRSTRRVTQSFGFRSGHTCGIAELSRFLAEIGGGLANDPRVGTRVLSGDGSRGGTGQQMFTGRIGQVDATARTEVAQALEQIGRKLGHPERTATTTTLCDRMITARPEEERTFFRHEHPNNVRHPIAAGSRRRRPSCLRCRHGRAVCRHDLRLIRKDFSATGVHDHLQPLHVVVAIPLVVTKRLDAGEVFEPASLAWSGLSTRK